MTLEIMDHSEKLAEIPDKPGTPSNPDPASSDPIIHEYGILDNYKTPNCKRVRRNKLRVIYALVQHRDAHKVFHIGEMQMAVRRLMGDDDLDVEELLLKFQKPEDDLTVAVRDSVKKLQLQDDVQALWDKIKPM